MSRSAICLVCDDILISMSGKFTALGIYTSDVGIPVPNHVLNQLAFLFVLETPADDPFRSLKFQVTLPGDAPREVTLPTLGPAVSASITKAKMISLKWPYLIQNVALRPGPIETLVTHDKGEIFSVPAMVTLLSRPAASA